MECGRGVANKLIYVYLYYFCLPFPFVVTSQSLMIENNEMKNHQMVKKLELLLFNLFYLLTTLQ